MSQTYPYGSPSPGVRGQSEETFYSFQGTPSQEPRALKFNQESTFPHAPRQPSPSVAPVVVKFPLHVGRPPWGFPKLWPQGTYLSPSQTWSDRLLRENKRTLFFHFFSLGPYRLQWPFLDTDKHFMPHFPAKSISCCSLLHSVALCPFYLHRE